MYVPFTLYLTVENQLPSFKPYKTQLRKWRFCRNLSTSSLWRSRTSVSGSVLSSYPSLPPESRQSSPFVSGRRITFCLHGWGTVQWICFYKKDIHSIWEVFIVVLYLDRRLIDEWQDPWHSFVLSFFWFREESYSRLLFTMVTFGLSSVLFSIASPPSSSKGKYLLSVTVELVLLLPGLWTSVIPPTRPSLGPLLEDPLSSFTFRHSTRPRELLIFHPGSPVSVRSFTLSPQTGRKLCLRGARLRREVVRERPKTLPVPTFISLGTPPVTINVYSPLVGQTLPPSPPGWYLWTMDVSITLRGYLTYHSLSLSVVLTEVPKPESLTVDHKLLYFPRVTSFILSF